MTTTPTFFPDQIITEILTRLPAKSVTRSKLVSKEWLNLISTSHFITSYISQNTPTWSILDRVIRFNPSPGSVGPDHLTLHSPPQVSFLSVGSDLYDSVLTGRYNYPAVVSASNGIILFATVIGRRDPFKEREKDLEFFSVETEQNCLFVVSSINFQFGQLPYPRHPINHRGCIAFTTRVDRKTGFVDRFLVVEYKPLVGSQFATLVCFSSETGKWKEIQTGYMLNMHMWRSEGAFEFDGRLFWIDSSIGLIFMNDDVETFGTRMSEDKVVQCGFVKLPDGCVRRFDTVGLDKSRHIGVGGGGGGDEGWIQFMQMGKKMVKLWRLKDYKCGEWSLAYKVSFEAEFRGLRPKPLFFHPFMADVAVCIRDDRLLFVNVRTKEVEWCGSYSNSAGVMFMMPLVLPSWPSPLPKLGAEASKDRGNDYFKIKKFDEAIQWYSSSITSSPTAVAYANRAAAYLNLKNFMEAEKDSTKALDLDAHFLKAYWRRAVARKELGKIGKALEDVELALKLNPDQVELQKLGAELKYLLQQATVDEDGKGNTVKGK